jgi:PBSX family phage portal protein
MTNDSGGPLAFSFGDPESVLDVSDFFYEGVYVGAGQLWYEPPVPFNILAKSYHATAWHGSAIQVKRNILTSLFRSNPYLSREQFGGMVLDLLIYGNLYAEDIRGRGGRRLRIERRLAKYMRRAQDLESYWYVPQFLNQVMIPGGRIGHVMNPDHQQEVYGLPDYIGGLQSAWLNESATLFRRRYYKNGSHAGFILYISDPATNQDDINQVRTALRESKGLGNFRNLLFYSPNGKKDGVQLIPIGEVAAKDEFWNLKNVTRDDQLAAHRIPPQLMGVVPSNAGGFGSVGEAARVFFYNELLPIQQQFDALNQWAGEPLVTFDPYPLAAAA